MMSDQVDLSGWDRAVAAMGAALRATGRIDAASVAMAAAGEGSVAVAYDVTRSTCVYDTGHRKGGAAMAVRSKRPTGPVPLRPGSMYFSNETVDWFLENANAAQMRCVADLLDRELSARKRNKREEAVQARRFPQMKSFEGYDWSAGGPARRLHTREELVALDFLDAAQDFVFYGQTGRGETHLAIAIGAAAVARGRPCASTRPPSCAAGRSARPPTSTRWRPR